MTPLRHVNFVLNVGKTGMVNTDKLTNLGFCPPELAGARRVFWGAARDDFRDFYLSDLLV